MQRPPNWFRGRERHVGSTHPEISDLKWRRSRCLVRAGLRGSFWLPGMLPNGLVESLHAAAIRLRPFATQLVYRPLVRAGVAFREFGYAPGFSHEHQDPLNPAD